MRRLSSILLLLIAAACAHHPAAPTASESAERYVRLALALGEHDPDWVDAYYGPPEWREAVKRERKSVADIQAEGVALREAVSRTAVPAERMERLRRNYLLEQLGALVTRAEMLQGKKYTFDEEARRLYGVTPPRHDDAYFDATLAELEKELPGQGTVTGRIDAYRNRFNVPAERVDAVIQAALEACRERTLGRIELPAGESFTLEYVKGQPWGAYNWYKGNFQSLIQVNMDLPLRIDRALDFACHEGYPGHHTYNALLEKNLVRGRGWVEYSIYPLNSPQSLIAEGSGNYGLKMAFPGEERMEFDRDVLFPLAGLDPAEAERFHKVQKLAASLSYASNEAARRWLDGELTREEAKAWLVRHGAYSPEQAEKQMKFIERYRSYVINYNVGQDLVRDWLEKVPAGEARWARFRELISSPMLPSDITR